MIKDLNTSVEASEVTNSSVPRDFGPLPKGTYDLRLIEVNDWRTKTLKNVRVISYDDRFQKVKDASGNDVVKVVDTLNIYETTLKFEVVDGPHKGRWVFHRVNTHPNRPWEIPNMLSAFGVPSIKLSNISTLVGVGVKANVDIENYNKKVVDEETGLENEIPIEYNVIKRFSKAEVTEADLDI